MAFFKKHQYFVCFLIVLFSGIFWKATRWEWQHPFLFAWSYLFYPLMWLLILGGLVKFLKEQWRRGQIKTFVISLLCLPILLLPFTRWYETGRFWLLKDRMEAVAIQYVMEYREEIAEHGTVFITLPAKIEYLSRKNGEISLRDENGMIQAVYHMSFSHSGPDWNLAYNTGIPSGYVPEFIYSSRWGPSVYLSADWELKSIPVEIKIEIKKWINGEL